MLVVVFLLILYKVIEAGSECGEYPTACGVPDREEDIWQHFTKINTKDPDVVYAVCHHCDRVLKAHSKNDTSHLRRHREANVHVRATVIHPPPSRIRRSYISSVQTSIFTIRGRWRTLLLRSPKWTHGGLPTPSYFTTSLTRETHHGRWGILR